MVQVEDQVRTFTASWTSSANGSLPRCTLGQPRARDDVAARSHAFLADGGAVIEDRH